MELLKTYANVRKERKYALVLLDSGRTVEIIVPVEMPEEDIMILAENYNKPIEEPKHPVDLSTVTTDEILAEIKKRPTEEIEVFKIEINKVSVTAEVIK